jgi:hypothetical protein
MMTSSHGLSSMNRPYWLFAYVKQLFDELEEGLWQAWVNVFGNAAQAERRFKRMVYNRKRYFDVWDTSVPEPVQAHEGEVFGRFVYHMSTGKMEWEGPIDADPFGERYLVKLRYAMAGMKDWIFGDALKALAVVGLPGFLMYLAEKAGPFLRFTAGNGRVTIWFFIMNISWPEMQRGRNVVVDVEA